MSEPHHRAPRRPLLRRAPDVLLGILAVGLVLVVVVTTVASQLIDDTTPSAGTVAEQVSGQSVATSDPPTPGPLHRLAREDADVATEMRKRAKARAAKLRAKAEEAAARKKKQKQQKQAPPPPPAPMTFKIGSFNVLGSQHTRAGGSKAGWPDAPARTAGTAELMRKHGVHILGTQELQDDQLRDLQNRTGMAAYPGFAWGAAETDNSILWNPGMFEMVSGSKFTITFMGRPRPQPIVRLRHLATGREFYVVNTHPSAGDGRYATERRNGQVALVNVVNDLKATGLPVLVTGDMNDREAFYCNVVPAAGLTASNGGSYGSGCQPPPEPIPVDWVVGSGAAWSGYWRDTTPVTRKISNHFFISATAQVG